MKTRKYSGPFAHITHNNLILVLALAVLWIAVPGQAQNMITNGDFDADVTGWAANVDRFDWISNDGASPSGNGCAEQADSMNNGGTGLSDWTTQIPVNADTQYTLSASIKKPAGSLANAAWFYVLFLDTNGTYLGETLSQNYTGDFSDNAWHSDFSFQFTTSTNAGYTIGFVWISLGVGTPGSGSGESILRWDNVKLIAGTPAPTPIFSDDFESGGTTQWDGTFPSP